jgi:hypothetical protein
LENYPKMLERCAWEVVRLNQSGQIRSVRLVRAVQSRTDAVQSSWATPQDAPGSSGRVDDVGRKTQSFGHIGGMPASWVVPCALPDASQTSSSSSSPKASKHHSPARRATALAKEGTIRASVDMATPPAFPGSPIHHGGSPSQFVPDPINPLDTVDTDIGHQYPSSSSHSPSSASSSPWQDAQIR